MEIHKIASMRLAQYQYVQQQQQQEQQKQLPTHIWLLRAAHGRVNWGRQRKSCEQRMRRQKRSQMSIQGMQSLHTRTQSVCGLSSNLPAEYLPDGYHTHTYIYICTHTHMYIHLCTHIVNEMQMQPKNVIIWHICTLCLPFSCSLSASSAFPSSAGQV